MSVGKIRKEGRAAMALRVAAVAAAVLLVTAGTLALVYRERLATDGVPGLFTGGAAALDADAFDYGAGSRQVFAAAGDGLAAASASSLALFNSRGTAVFRRAVSFDAPAVFASESGALFCDIGGTGCVAVTAAGEARTLEPEGTILTASRSGAGWIALGTEAAGSRGTVCVYAPDGALRYRWRSGTGYLLCCRVSPDGDALAALCAEDGGGRLHLFRMDSEEEAASVAFPGEIPFDLRYMGGGALCVLGAQTLHFLDGDGNETGRAETGGVLLDYEFGGTDFAAVLTAASAGAQRAWLTTLDRSGTVLGSAEAAAGASLSARGRRLLVCGEGLLRLYDRGLSPVWEGAAPEGAASALLRGRESALLPGPFAAQAVSLGS